MPTAKGAPNRAATRVRELPATFTAGQARHHGITPRDLYRMRDEGALHELSRGVFRAADAPETAHLDLLAVATRAPNAITCLESALALHDLIDDIPSAVHIAVARGHHVPTVTYPSTVVYRFDAATFNLGLDRFEAAPREHVRVYNPARSIVDAMRLRHRIGTSLALGALNQYLRRSGHSGVPELLTLARHLNVEGPVRSTIEAVLA
jgi:hypothetical protein